uniref:Uncharacterized protein n=1 Tax=Magnetovibrio blakemorei TaxID=28181 RepID=C4RAI0_9PROT|nr:hypothetical protein mv1g00078 [Magnetovibrio blakemorei]
MGGRERLRHVQAWHFVFSIAEDGTEEGVERKLRNAVRVTVDGAFTAKGFKSVWGIHQNHTDHIHAHAVVRALSDFGGRLHSDIHGDFLHALRLRFAENLKLAGLDYNATRRVDRQYTRERILAGYEPLHDDQSPWREGKAHRDPYANLKTWPYYFGDRAVQNMERIEDAKAMVRQLAEEADIQERMSIFPAAGWSNARLHGLAVAADWPKTGSKPSPALKHGCSSLTYGASVDFWQGADII